MVVDPVDVAGTADDDEMLLSELDDPLRDNFGLLYHNRNNLPPLQKLFM
jgi:hypothetical protein